MYQIVSKSNSLEIMRIFLSYVIGKSLSLTRFKKKKLKYFYESFEYL